MKQNCGPTLQNFKVRARSSQTSIPYHVLQFYPIMRGESRNETDQRSQLSADTGVASSRPFAAQAGGVELSQGFLRRVDEINRATRAIMRGDLADRIRTTGSGDELDQLGRNLNDMLDRLQGLMDGLKQVSTDIAHDLRTLAPVIRSRAHVSK